jgi:hypothetical protein
MVQEGETGMAERSEQERELIGRTAQLERRHWRWLKEAADRNHSRSTSHELRRVVDAEIERNAPAREATAA